MNTDSDNSTLNVRFSHCGIWDEFGDGKISSCTLTILVLCFSAKEEHLLINAHCVRILMLFCVQTIDVKHIAEVEQSGTEICKVLTCFWRKVQVSVRVTLCEQFHCAEYWGIKHGYRCRCGCSFKRDLNAL